MTDRPTSVPIARSRITCAAPVAAVIAQRRVESDQADRQRLEEGDDVGPLGLEGLPARVALLAQPADEPLWPHDVAPGDAIERAPHAVEGLAAADGDDDGNERHDDQAGDQRRGRFHRRRASHMRHGHTGQGVTVTIPRGAWGSATRSTGSRGDRTRPG